MDKVVCAGTALPEPDASHAQHSSYVSLLWPLMGLILSIDRLGQPSGVSYPMLELAQAGLITAVDWQSIGLGQSKDPDKLTVGSQRPIPLPGDVTVLPPGLGCLKPIFKNFDRRSVGPTP